MLYRIGLCTNNADLSIPEISQIPLPNDSYRKRDAGAASGDMPGADRRAARGAGRRPLFVGVYTGAGTYVDHQGIPTSTSNDCLIYWV